MGEYFHDVGVIVDGGENEMGFSKVAAAHFLDELIGVVWFLIIMIHIRLLIHWDYVIEEGQNTTLAS